jgi:quinoprotein glucose dehydrogenase
MTSTAPAMPDGDWQAYGRTEFGDRYSPLRQITPQNVGRWKKPGASAPATCRPR